MALKKNTLKVSSIKTASVSGVPSQREEEVVELDIIQRLHNNMEALKERQQRLAFMTGELKTVLGVKKSK